MKSFRYCPTIGMLVAMLGCPNGAHPQTPAPAATPNRIEVEWKAAPRESTSSEGSPVAQPVISASSTAPAAISPPLTLPSAAAPDPFGPELFGLMQRRERIDPIRTFTVGSEISQNESYGLTGGD